jgi:hypothetical protein
MDATQLEQDLEDRNVYSTIEAAVGMMEELPYDEVTGHLRRDLIIILGDYAEDFEKGKYPKEYSFGQYAREYPERHQVIISHLSRAVESLNIKI